MARVARAGEGCVRAAQSRQMPERALGLLLTSGGWWVGLGSKAAHRPKGRNTLKAVADEAGRGYTCGTSRGASAPRMHSTERLLSLRRAQPAPPLHTRGVLPAERRETWVLVAGGQQGRCRGVG